MRIYQDEVVLSFESFAGAPRKIINDPAQHVIDAVVSSGAVNINLTVFDAALQTMIVFKFDGEWHEVCNRTYNRIAS